MQKESSSSNTGTIIGVTVGIVAVAALGAAAVAFVFMKKKKMADTEKAEGAANLTQPLAGGEQKKGPEATGSPGARSDNI